MDIENSISGIVSGLLAVIGTYYAKVKKQFDKVDEMQTALNQTLSEITSLRSEVESLKSENSILKDFDSKSLPKFDNLIRVDDRVKALFKAIDKIDGNVENNLDKMNNEFRATIKEIWRIIREQEIECRKQLDKKQDKK